MRSATDRIIQGVEGLSGPEKAAALLVAIGKPAASRLLKYLDADDLRRLAAHARRLPSIAPSDYEFLVKEFEDDFTEGAPLSEAGTRFEGLLKDTLPPEEASAVIEGKQFGLLPLEPVWEKLPGVPVHVLHAYLEHEHPQTIAYVVSRMPPEPAAKLLIGFEARLRSNVVRRTLRIRKVSEPVNYAVENVLRREVTSNEGMDDDSNRHGRIAEIINQLDKTQVDDMLDSLADLNVDDLAQIKAKLFSFEDIGRISQQARLTIFDEVQTEQVTNALRGADDHLREMVLSALSARSRRMVEAELSSFDDNANAPEVVEARKRIARLAISLAERGEVSLAPAEQMAS